MVEHFSDGSICGAFVLTTAPAQRKLFGAIRRAVILESREGVQILTLVLSLSTYCVPSTGPERLEILKYWFLW